MLRGGIGVLVDHVGTAGTRRRFYRTSHDLATGRVPMLFIAGPEIIDGIDELLKAFLQSLEAGFIQLCRLGKRTDQGGHSFAHRLISHCHVSRKNFQ